MKQHVLQEGTFTSYYDNYMFIAYYRHFTQLCLIPLQIAKKTLPFYNKYFGISYLLPKMDLIAIPDFAIGEKNATGKMQLGEKGNKMP